MLWPLRPPAMAYMHLSHLSIDPGHRTTCAEGPDLVDSVLLGGLGRQDHLPIKLESHDHISRQLSRCW
jgi:hypothetical protein